MNREELIKQKALEFLRANDMMVIATISEDGEPQSSAVYYAVDDDFTLYFITGSQTKKIKNLSWNKKVAFTITSNEIVNTIQGGGKAEVIEEKDSGHFIKVLEHNHIKRFSEWPIFNLNEKGFVVVKITPNWMTWLNLNKKDPSELYQDDFYKII